MKLKMKTNVKLKLCKQSCKSPTDITDITMLNTPLFTHIKSKLEYSEP
jgi:hypothetical protein